MWFNPCATTAAGLWFADRMGFDAEWRDKMLLEKVKNCVRNLFSGEVTLKKRELWLIAALCLCAGIISGIKKAPWTHGVQIASNNGNNNGNGNSNGSQEKLPVPEGKKEEEEE